MVFKIFCLFPRGLSNDLWLIGLCEKNILFVCYYREQVLSKPLEDSYHKWRNESVCFPLFLHTKAEILFMWWCSLFRKYYLVLSKNFSRIMYLPKQLLYQWCRIKKFLVWTWSKPPAIDANPAKPVEAGNMRSASVVVALESRLNPASRSRDVNSGLRPSILKDIQFFYLKFNLENIENHSQMMVLLIAKLWPLLYLTKSANKKCVPLMIKGTP